ncbi:hypothetical protein MAR_013344 [Mya arenaria]|uniref:Uncharacterized protein n=1 Tax=Mya arenaria TaxID=6604 RepID=A0ABY7FZJ9_MYAAR|nr:hypothetical protein MAR_013344 [Mya arenaria]
MRFWVSSSRDDC